jgi:competence protein ComEC
MNYFARAPLVKILIPLIVGIITGIYTAHSFDFANPFIFAFFLILLIFTFSKLSAIYRFRKIYGWVLNLFLIASGYQLSNLKTEIFLPDHFSKIENAKYFIAEISDPVSEKEKSYKVELKIIAAYVEDDLIKVKGRAMAYFQKDSAAANLEMHDQILLPSYFKDLDSPGNPGEFNYKRYLSFHQVYQQGYFKSGDWKISAKRGGAFVFQFAHQLRKNLLSIFEQFNIKEQEYAVASALMVGYKDKIDTEITRAYAGAGAMHVLAVSGLHVGIIYLILNYLFFFLNSGFKQTVFKSVLIIFLLWSYALITGLSPSVLRASAMFSIIIIGKAIGRNTDIYNSLAASAIVLLMINPYLIMEVGFQLSYLAVAGIVYLQPKIYNLIDIKYKLIDYVWGLTAVSLAAQIATFPLGLLYFHQFPNYFLLSNLIVIPGAVLIIYLGVMLFAFSSFEMIAQYIAIVFNACLYALNYAVKWFEKLPYSISEGIYVSVSETWLIYAVIITLVAFFVTARKRFFYLFCLGGILFFWADVYKRWFHLSVDKMVIYNTPKHTALNFMERDKNIIITSLSETQDKEAILFHMKNNWIRNGFKSGKLFNVRETSFNPENEGLEKLKSYENFYIFSGKKILHIKNKLDWLELPKKLKVDYVIISNNPAFKLADLLNCIIPEKVIFDASNSANLIQRLKKECEAFNLVYHNVAESGAYVLELNK